MRAVVQSVYGPPSVLSLADLPAPTAGPRQVVIEVHASAVTQGDRRLRAGDFPAVAWIPGRLIIGLTGPRSGVPGTMFAGRVVAVGAEVRRFVVGDDVYGNAMKGAYAERVVMDEAGLVAKMPRGSTYAEAASLPYAGMTSLLYLRDLAKVGPGQRLCVLGAAGGVGRVVTQLGAYRGAVVTAVARRDDEALLRSLGAATVLDYRTDDWRACGPYDVVLDTNGVSGFGAARPALTATGSYLTLIVSFGLLLQMAWARLTGGQRALASVAMGTQADLDELAALVEAGAVRPPVARTFPLEQVVEAHTYLETGRPRGAVILEVRPQPLAAVAV